MNSLVKNFMTNNKTVVAYVRDEYGFRKGIVVAVGPGKLGYSLVKKSEDFQWVKMLPHQLPVVQRMGTMGFPPEEIVTSKPYQRCIRNWNQVRVPDFNKDTGLFYAFDSALNGEITYLPDTQEFETIMEVDKVVYTNGELIKKMKSAIPSDKDLWKVIRTVAERSLKVKW